MNDHRQACDRKERLGKVQLYKDRKREENHIKNNIVAVVLN